MYEAFKAEWGVISAAPFSIAVIVAATMFITVLFTRWSLGSEAAGARERAKSLEDRLKFKEEDNNTLLSKLAGHGEDIEVLKKELAERPRVFVSAEEPKDTKAGDIWVQP